MSETRPKARTSFSTSTAAERSHTHTPSSRPEWILFRASEATPVAEVDAGMRAVGLRAQC